MSFYLRLAVTPSTSALPCAATVPCWHHPPFPCLQSPLGFSLCFFCDRQDALFVPWLDVGGGALLSQDAGQKTFCAPAAEPSQMFTLDPEQRKSTFSHWVCLLRSLPIILWQSGVSVLAVWNPQAHGLGVSKILSLASLQDSLFKAGSSDSSLLWLCPRSLRQYFAFSSSCLLVVIIEPMESHGSESE